MGFLDLPTNAEPPSHVRLALDYDRAFRAHVLYEAISLEDALGKVIAWHFCADEAKHGAFHSFVFRDGEILLAKKVQILRNLLKYSYPDLRETYVFLAKELDAVRALRNKFAHSSLHWPDDPPPADKSEGVTLCYLKNGTQETEFVPRSGVDAYVSNAKYLYLSLALLAEVVKGRSMGQPTKDEVAFAHIVKACRDSLRPIRPPGSAQPSPSAAK